MCELDFSISSGGRTDDRRHQDSACHGESNEGFRARALLSTKMNS